MQKCVAVEDVDEEVVKEPSTDIAKVCDIRMHFLFGISSATSSFPETGAATVGNPLSIRRRHGRVLRRSRRGRKKTKDKKAKKPVRSV